MSAILLTLQVATVATVLVMIPGTALAYVLARFDFRGRKLLSTLVLLPLVLPPTAVGYLLLRMLAVDGWIGGLLASMDIRILLTWRAAVLAAMVMALPLVVRTARVAFEGVDPRLEAMDRTLGHSAPEVFWRITLPLAARGLLAAAILGFTRAVGEFGATVTIAGNIPGSTQTLASAIFAAQSSGAESEVWVLLFFSLAVGVVAIYSSERLAEGSVKR